LIASKTRLSPLKAISIPRLELMGALIGVRLTKQVSTALEIPVKDSTSWVDSMNVLHWIHGRSRDYKPFVAHRVGEIHDESCPDQWKHVPTELNPADYGSRGRNACKELKVEARKQEIRVRSWVHRFINNCRRSREESTHGELTPDEVRSTEEIIIQKAQHESYPDEIEALKQNRNLPKKSSILTFTPILMDGLLRSNTRLRYAEHLPNRV
ncbi:Hypothetical predicted protein, partial [Paramuricea clavata]